MCKPDLLPQKHKGMEMRSGRMRRTAGNELGWQLVDCFIDLLKIVMKGLQFCVQTSTASEDGSRSCSAGPRPTTASSCKFRRSQAAPKLQYKSNTKHYAHLQSTIRGNWLGRVFVRALLLVEPFINQPSQTMKYLFSSAIIAAVDTCRSDIHPALSALFVARIRMAEEW